MGRNNSGQFSIGFKPWNSGKRKTFDLEKIRYEHWQVGKSIIDISKEIGVSDRLIRIRMKENNIPIRKNTSPSDLIRRKISLTLINKKIMPTIRYSGDVWNKGLTDKDERVKKNIQGLLENRKNQITPVNDTKIEKRVQNLLKKFNIFFIPHKFIDDIRHSYQCDIYIPIQENINKKTIIECDGCYWHGCKICNKIITKKQRKQINKDNKRTKELIGAGYNIIRFWEHDINKFNIYNFNILNDIYK